MKWLASIHYNDDPYAPVLRLGMEGTSDGFLAVDEEGELISTELGYSVEDIRAIIADFCGHYDTFQWLDG